MSKITFRADDDLVERVESLDASKSQVMREALRSYLDGRQPAVADLDLVDELVTERVERVLDDRLDRDDERSVDVTITVEHVYDGDVRVDERQSSPPTASNPSHAADRGSGVRNAASGTDDRSCGRCGESLSGDYVFCPNCGEKAARRLFCECGDELRSDWAYCPGCGRRTPSAEVLDG